MSMGYCSGCDEWMETGDSVEVVLTFDDPITTGVDELDLPPITGVRVYMHPACAQAA